MKPHLRCLVVIFVLVSSWKAHADDIKRFQFLSTPGKYFVKDQGKLKADLELIRLLSNSNALQLASNTSPFSGLNFFFEIEENERDGCCFIRFGDTYTKISYALTFSGPKSGTAQLSDFRTGSAEECLAVKSLLESIQWQPYIEARIYGRLAVRTYTYLTLQFECDKNILKGTLSISGETVS